MVQYPYNEWANQPQFPLLHSLQNQDRSSVVSILPTLTIYLLPGNLLSNRMVSFVYMGAHYLLQKSAA
jgi:hypothetical protein